MDDITRARMADEIDRFKDTADGVAGAFGDMQDKIGDLSVIPAEFEKLGIPTHLGGNGTFLLGYEIGAMARVYTIQECHLIIDAVSAIEPDERYDVEEGPPLTERMLDTGLLNATQRHLRLTRVAIQELIYDLEDHNEEQLDKGGEHVPISELRRRALAGARFMVDTMFPIYAHLPDDASAV